MSKNTIGFPVDIYVKEREALILFNFHSETNVIVLAAKVGVEFIKASFTIWPDIESVVNVLEPALRLVLRPLSTL